MGVRGAKFHAVENLCVTSDALPQNLSCPLVSVYKWTAQFKPMLFKLISSCLAYAPNTSNSTYQPTLHPVVLVFLNTKNIPTTS